MGNTQRELKIPVVVKCTTSNKYNFNFSTSVAYCAAYNIQHLVDKIMKIISDKYHPVHFRFNCIENGSFTNYIHYNANALLNKAITTFCKEDIINKGLIIQFKIERTVKIKNNNVINCKYMMQKNSSDPIDCPIYNDTFTKYGKPINNPQKSTSSTESASQRYVPSRPRSSHSEPKNNLDNSQQPNWQHSDNNPLNHLCAFTHFKREYVDKPQCQEYDQCPAFKRIESKNEVFEDQCHLKLFRHAPKYKNIGIGEFHEFIANKTASQNHPLYKPTQSDREKYKFDETNGFLNALIGEIIRNGFKNDLCLQCGSSDDCTHNKYSILQIVESKLKHICHKQMGCPLRKDHMLSIILYTGTDCNYEFCKDQYKNKDYKKWKWFDYCLYNAIYKLSERECDEFSVYSGLNDVILTKKFMKKAWFPSYVSTSWIKEISLQFVGNKGVIMEFDSEFTKHNIVCDVSWISKFPDEFEMLFARSVERNYNSFECHVVDFQNGIQTVTAKDSSAVAYYNVLIKSYDDIKQQAKQIDIDVDTNSEWQCPLCTLLNPNTNIKCAACDNIRDFDEKNSNSKPIDPSPIISVPVDFQCITDLNSKYDTNVNLSVPFTHSIEQLINDALLWLNKKYRPTMFELSYVKANSFIGIKLTPHNKDAKLILGQSLISYDKHDIINKKLCLAVNIGVYHHSVLSKKITCPHMIKAESNDPTNCAVYAIMKYQFQFTNDNLHHMQNYVHFCNEYKEIPECKYKDECKAYKRLQNGGNEVKDECHLILYIHPPRRREIKLEEDIHSFIVNKKAEENHPLYEPSNDDDIKYEHNEKDGYLLALIEEVVNNGMKNELYMGSDKYAAHDENDTNYTLLNKVNSKMNCPRHIKMGKPLSRDEMLAIILYTETDCTYKLCSTQRKGNFNTWKWMDLCLYSAIQKLGIREFGSYTLFSGVDNVKLNQKVIKNAYFMTYVSSTCIKEITQSFVGTKGMILQIDESFREAFSSVCCDVSWISKFGIHESEVLIARSIDITNNFEMRVVDEKNGFQIVLLTKNETTYIPQNNNDNH